MRQIPEGPGVLSVSDAKTIDRFVELWKPLGIQQFIPNYRFSEMLHDLYCLSLKAKVKNRVRKQCGICCPCIAAHTRHRQDGCSLEVLGKKVIDEEEDISHEEEENS